MDFLYYAAKEKLSPEQRELRPSLSWALELEVKFLQLPAMFLNGKSFLKDAKDCVVKLGSGATETQLKDFASDLVLALGAAVCNFWTYGHKWTDHQLVDALDISHLLAGCEELSVFLRLRREMRELPHSNQLLPDYASIHQVLAYLCDLLKAEAGKSRSLPQFHEVQTALTHDFNHPHTVAQVFGKVEHYTHTRAQLWRDDLHDTNEEHVAETMARLLSGLIASLTAKHFVSVFVLGLPVDKVAVSRAWEVFGQDFQSVAYCSSTVHAGRRDEQASPPPSAFPELGKRAAKIYGFHKAMGVSTLA